MCLCFLLHGAFRICQVAWKPYDETATDFRPSLGPKLHRPAVSGDVIVRQHLFDRLEAGRNLPLTLVSASAGYGKTSLVSQWLKQGERPAAWISLGRSEAELREFLTYFIVAVESIFPDSLHTLSGHTNRVYSLQVYIQHSFSLDFRIFLRWA